MTVTLKVNEIFKSIQGESSFAGKPCTFVRLSGCNLRCKYCDTEYAYNDYREISCEEVISEVKALKTPLVEITGGEPLMQAGTLELTKKLFDSGYRVLVETNGSIDLREISSLREGRELFIIMDIKTPGSGMEEEIIWNNLNYLSQHDEIKFVIGGIGDFSWASGIVRQYELDKKFTIHFSPVFGKIKPADLCDWILGSNMDIRLNLQLQKIIWGDSQRGV